MITKPTVSLLLDERRIKKDKTFPVKLSIYFGRGQKKLLPLPYSFTKEHWKKINSTSQKSIKQRQYNTELLEIIYKAEYLLDKLRSPSDFDKETFLHEISKDSKFLMWYINRHTQELEKIYQEQIEKMRNSGRLASMELFRLSLNSLLSFKNPLLLGSINPDFLHDYERHMEQKGNSRSTVGLYLRYLRIVLNIALKKGLIDYSQYPFTRAGYTIPGSDTKRQSLNAEELRSFVEYLPANEGQSRAKDMWLMSYLAFGANAKDLCKLRYSNISDNMIVFIRSKTKNTTRRRLPEATISITKELEQIIMKWGNKKTSPSQYILPVLKEEMSQEEQHKAVLQFRRNTNKRLACISEKLNLRFPLNLNCARHTAMTILKNKGYSDLIIRDLVAHSTFENLKHYLGTLDVKDIHTIGNSMLDFETSK